MYHVVLVALVVSAVAFGYFLGQVLPFKRRQRDSTVTVHLACDTSAFDKAMAEFKRQLSETARRTGLSISDIT